MTMVKGVTVHDEPLLESGKFQNPSEEKSRQVRTKVTEQQLTILKQMYAVNQRPDAMTVEQLVEMTGFNSHVIRVWFENRRSKDKRRQAALREQQQDQEKSQQVRTKVTEQQLTILKQMYGINQQPDAVTVERLVELTGFSSHVIRVWFQNRRSKDKRLQAAMREQQQNQEKVTLGQRFVEQIKLMCTLLGPCVRTAGYLLMALLGSIILVLAFVSPIVAPCASYVLAHLASPGYNSTWDDWTGRELGVRIQGALAYAIMALCLCVWVNQAYMLLMNFWILFRCCLLKATSQPLSSSALRADLIKRALTSHFRRIFLLFLFHLITLLVVYPLVVLGVPCLTGIMFAQMCVYIPLEFFNLFLRGRYRVIMRLPESEVSAITMDKKELTRRFNEAGLPGI